MNIITSVQEMQAYTQAFRKAGKVIALAPTMGALHDGHISLLKNARNHGDVSVMSVFVNPAQFGPREDYAKYPRPFESDCAKAETAGCDVVFAPRPEDIYPKGHSTFITVEGLSDRLCGASRPGHFRGVATVVAKFINIVGPHFAVFGQKDAMQCIVLKRMVHDLNVSVQLIFAPTVRESDGLAMSSRNTYLSSAERHEASLIYKGLIAARQRYEAGERDAARIVSMIREMYKRSSLFSTEYVEIVDTEFALPCVNLDGPSLIAVAVRTSESSTRLIDNIILGGTF